jgi:hypothetical protein
LSNEPKQDGEPFDRGVIERLITMLRVWAEHQLIQAPRDIELSSEVQALLDAYDRLAAESKARAERPPQPAPATAAELDSLRRNLAILTCRVAALESAQLRGPSVPGCPLPPYPVSPVPIPMWPGVDPAPFGPERPWITFGTRTSDKTEERA